ncbi:MAG: DUF808 domain-containing protein [Myxococcota bacterium]
MPTPSLFALLDDIASVLDDVAVLTQAATKKTAGVLGDDLALNAEQVAGVRAERELPVVWAVAKGSLVNKSILVPAALAISAFIPWGIKPLLMVGGAFLCFEGCEKLAHKFLHSKEAESKHHEEHVHALVNPEIDLVALERDKIKGAIRTDFVLSAEIIVIALGTVQGVPLTTQVVVLIGLSLLMTLGVYGLVAGIVKLDDFGQYLAAQAKRGRSALASLQEGLSKAILLAAPWLMKALSVAGTIAMFLVGGGIVSHAIPHLHHVVHEHAEAARAQPFVGPVWSAIVPILVDLLVGLITGTLVLLVWNAISRLRSRKPAGAV